jgi:hypothetical protein
MALVPWQQRTPPCRQARLPTRANDIYVNGAARFVVYTYRQHMLRRRLWGCCLSPAVASCQLRPMGRICKVWNVCFPPVYERKVRRKRFRRLCKSSNNLSRIISWVLTPGDREWRKSPKHHTNGQKFVLTWHAVLHPLALNLPCFQFSIEFLKSAKHAWLLGPERIRRTGLTDISPQRCASKAPYMAQNASAALGSEQGV